MSRVDEIKKRLADYQAANIGPTVVGTIAGFHRQFVTVAMKADGKSLEANCGVMSDRNRAKAALFAFAADDIEFLLGLANEPAATGHITRLSDSSVYDEVCINCGATDARNDDRLNQPCPKIKTRQGAS